MHEFLRLNNELTGLSRHASNTEDRKSEILERMISLYSGDLMEGSDYGDLVLLERERCKSIFEDACLKLSSIYTKRGELRQAEEILRRAFAADPFNEDVCLELLKLFMSQGMRSKAVSFITALKSTYKKTTAFSYDGFV